MYTLYYSPGACSMAVHVALLECGQTCKLEKVDLQNRSPEFMKLNPRGTVPVLMDGDQMLREGAAILIHLLDKHQSPLLPQSGTARDEAIEWLMFANATLHPAYARVFFLRKNGMDDGNLVDAAIAKTNDLWAEVDQRLASQKYICGAQITIADILMTVFANWAGMLPKPVTLGENVKRLLKEISSRPAYQKALAQENVEYKAAAA
jgi:glutathione S-transferase